MFVKYRDFEERFMLRGQLFEDLVLAFVAAIMSANHSLCRSGSHAFLVP